MFLAVTGYKGSGKDTFAQALLGNNSTSWLIYGNKPWTSLDDIPKVVCSLAQPIKTIVHNHINIPYSEENKNMVVPSGGTIPYLNKSNRMSNGMSSNRISLERMSSDGMTIRQMYIAVAEEAKKDNSYIWVEALRASILPNLYSIVADVRFPCELERLQCPSIRIYRSNDQQNARITSEDITETSLDHHQCDYFAVTSESEAALLFSEFPQYSNHTLVSKVN